MTGGGVGSRIRILFRRHGIVGRPHDLRHSFATEAARWCNWNLVAVKGLMRHSEVTTTMRYVRPPDTGHNIVDAMYGDAA
jgi:integrase